MLLPQFSAAAQEKAASGDRKPTAATAKELERAVAVAERHVAIKAAEMKMAEAQVEIAKARLKVLNTKHATAKEIEAYAAAKLRRLMELRRKSKAAAEEVVIDAESSLRSAEGLRRQAEDNVAVGQAQVSFEIAGREAAEARLAESSLRLDQLRERLRASK